MNSNEIARQISQNVTEPAIFWLAAAFVAGMLALAIWQNWRNK
jgi:hypothetical protein